MTLWDALILGVVQGLTEFLPVSSSGHLVVFQDRLGVEGGTLTFDIVVHFGTLLAVLVALRDDWSPMLTGLFDPGERAESARRIGHLILGTLPIAAVGLLFKETLAPLFSSTTAVGVMLLVTGTVLWVGDALAKKAGRGRALDELNAADAFVIGCGQALAILPGLSRSGTTLSVGLARGLNREAAARFAFLLAIPAILGATVTELPELVGGEASELGPLAVGLAASAVSGYFAISLFLRFLRRGSLRGYSYYTWALGLLVLFVV